MVNEVFALEYNLNENDSERRYVKLNAQHDRFAEAQLLNGNIIKDQGRNKILPEILRDIFPFLKRDILGKCQLVNLLWNQVIKGMLIAHCNNVTVKIGSLYSGLHCNKVSRPKKLHMGWEKGGTAYHVYADVTDVDITDAYVTGVDATNADIGVCI